MSPTDKITILAFDETYLSQKICYDKKAEQFIGPHKTVQTLVARGKNFKIDVVFLIK